MKRFVLIDAFDFLHRAYHALPTTLRNKKGELVNAVYGFTSMLISLIGELEPDFLVVATELKGPTFRNAQFAGYKATRVKDEEKEKEFLVQVPKVERILDSFGIPHLCVEGYEADDVIGSLAKQASELTTDNLQLTTIIVGNDQDLLQLVGGGVKVYMPKRGKREAILFDKKKVKEVYGFTPKQMVDFKALCGDPSDNIPGVFGIGEKIAVKLLRKFGSVESLYNNLSKVAPLFGGKVAERLAEGAEQAVLSKKLATIALDAPVKLELKKCRFQKINKKEGIKVLEEFGFRSLVKRLGGQENSKVGKKDSQLPLL